MKKKQYYSHMSPLSNSNSNYISSYSSSSSSSSYSSASSLSILKNPWLNDALCGSVCAIMSNSLFYPLDTLRSQAIMKRRGISLYAGWRASTSRDFIYNTVRFGCMQYGDKHDRSWTREINGGSNVMRAAYGFCTGILASFCSSPFEQWKYTRMTNLNQRWYPPLKLPPGWNWTLLRNGIGQTLLFYNWSKRDTMTMTAATTSVTFPTSTYHYYYYYWWQASCLGAQIGLVTHPLDYIRIHVYHRASSIQMTRLLRTWPYTILIASLGTGTTLTLWHTLIG